MPDRNLATADIRPADIPHVKTLRHRQHQILGRSLENLLSANVPRHTDLLGLCTAV